MEENISAEVMETETVAEARGDEFWKAHLFSAQELKGSDREYCRRGGIRGGANQKIYPEPRAVGR